MTKVLVAIVSIALAAGLCLMAVPAATESAPVVNPTTGGLEELAPRVAQLDPGLRAIAAGLAGLGALLSGVAFVTAAALVARSERFRGLCMPLAAFATPLIAYGAIVLWNAAEWASSVPGQ